MEDTKEQKTEEKKQDVEMKPPEEFIYEALPTEEKKQ